MPNLSNFLGAGSIVTGFLFAGAIILVSDFISKKFTKGRLHPSAIAIFFGLIFAYVGGLHLFRSGDEEVTAFARRVRETGVQHIYTGHCTGERAMEILKEELGDVVQELYTGLTIEI